MARSRRSDAASTVDRLGARRCWRRLRLREWAQIGRHGHPDAAIWADNELGAKIRARNRINDDFITFAGTVLQVARGLKIAQRHEGADFQLRICFGFWVRA